MPRPRWTPFPLLPLALLLACQDPPQAVALDPTSPAQTHLGVSSIAGRVLGPDGTSICNFLLPASTYIVRAIRYPDPGAIAATQVLTCPLDAYDLPTDSGSFALRVQGLGPLTFAPIPDRVINLGPIVVSATSDTTVDLPVENGVALGGGASVDGVPSGGLALAATYSGLTAFGAAFGVSSTAGGWEETFGRAPLLLQADLDYTFTPCIQLVGARLVDSIPLTSIHFPVPVSAANCTGVSSRAANFTHSASGLVTGALPGDIGGLSPNTGDLGFGYGVQFSTPSQPPVHVAMDAAPGQLFIGGLLVAASPGQILTGADIGGYINCVSFPCRDLGPGARGQVIATPQGNRIVWRYDDSRSPQPVGIGLVQESVDGPPGSDYTLFRYRITNRGNAPLTLRPGLFMDWDVNNDGGFNTGFTALNGQLTYVSDVDFSGTPIGPAVGTMIFAARQPSPGAFVFASINGKLTLADVYDAMTGAVQQPTFGPADVQYIQGGAPVAIPAHKFRDVWVAVVAGDDVAALLVNAQAAATAVGQTQGAALPSGAVVATAGPLGKPGRAPIKPMPRRPGQ